MKIFLINIFTPKWALMLLGSLLIKSISVSALCSAMIMHKCNLYRTALPSRRVKTKQGLIRYIWRVSSSNNQVAMTKDKQEANNIKYSIQSYFLTTLFQCWSIWQHVLEETACHISDLVKRLIERILAFQHWFSSILEQSVIVTLLLLKKNIAL